ncbi:heme-binding protein, partial [Pseudomonas sp. MWU12-2534b]
RHLAVGGGHPIILNGEVVGAICILGRNVQPDHYRCVLGLKSQGLELL